MQSQVLSMVTVDLPLTVAEIKQHLIIEHDDDDVLIMRYIVAALDYAETRTELSLRVRKMRVFGPCWPSRVILPHGPVRQINSVTYLDDSNEAQTIVADDWDVYPHQGGAALDFHITPPSIGSTRRDAAAIEYLAGYGPLEGVTVNVQGFPYTLPMVFGQGSSLETSNGETLPNNIRQGLYMLIGHWYENRETTVIGTISGKLAHAADDLFGSMRIMGV